MSGRRSGSALAPALAVAVALAAGASVPRRRRALRAAPADKAHPRLKYDDSLTSINDRCAVKEDELSPSIRPVYVNAQPVGFCCTTCPAVFVQGPEPYLQRMKASFTDPVRPSRPAKIQAPLRYHVNWEVFYFADRASMDEFRKHPTAYCGWLTDPVSGVRFRPTAGSPRVIHAGRLVLLHQRLDAGRSSGRADQLRLPQGSLMRAPGFAAIAVLAVLGALAPGAERRVPLREDGRPEVPPDQVPGFAGFGERPLHRRGIGAVDDDPAHATSTAGRSATAAPGARACSCATPRRGSRTRACRCTASSSRRSPRCWTWRIARWWGRTGSSSRAPRRRRSSTPTRWRTSRR